MDLAEGELGLRVDFIPYNMKDQVKNSSFINICSTQNASFQEMGALAIEGITEEKMLTGTSTKSTPPHQRIKEQPEIIRIEKSDTPKINKWWILFYKDQQEDVNVFIDDKMQQYLKQHYPTTVKPIRTANPIAKGTPRTPHLHANTLLRWLQERAPSHVLKTPPPTGPHA